MRAVCIQLEYELKRFDAPLESIDSVFIGGGTPSTVSPLEYEPFFARLNPYLAKNAEITSEANPHSATPFWLEGMRTLGVNRISLGVQSFDASKLSFLGRNHTPKMAMDAISHASKIGFENLSLDLIYGVKGDSLSLLENDLAIARSLPINHLSAYALTLEEETPFFKRSDVTNPNVDLARAFVKKIIQTGFPQYEISNFGTYQSKHNKGYWEQKNYMGIGSGAVGFLKDHRFYPSKNLEHYLREPHACEEEMLSEEDLHVERIFLGLRSTIGMDISEFSPTESAKITLLVKENKLTCKDNRIYNKDYFLSDEIALFILQ